MNRSIININLYTTTDEQHTSIHLLKHYVLHLKSNVKGKKSRTFSHPPIPDIFVFTLGLKQNFPSSQWKHQQVMIKPRDHFSEVSPIIFK